MLRVMHRRWVEGTLVLSILTLFFIHVQGYSFLNDDAYISFRYAAHWADHGEISYNLGERVEGYTNFLWVALLAGFRVFGVDIPQASLWLSACLSLGTLLLIWRESSRLLNTPLSTQALHNAQPAQVNIRALLPMILLAMSPSFACWTSGGLEVQLFTTLFVMSGLSCVRAWNQPSIMNGLNAGILYGLTALTRPEGVLLFGIAGLYRLIRVLSRQTSWGKSDWGGIVGFSFIFIPYFTWRYQYYGYPFPNTYYAKTGASGFWVPGVHYVISWFKANPWLALVPFAFFVGLRSHQVIPDQAEINSTNTQIESLNQRRAWRDLYWLVIFSSLALIIHVARVGGDFMALHRFLVPLLPFGALLASFSLIKITQRLPATLWLITALLFVTHIELAQREYRYANRIGSEQGVDSIGWLRQFSEKCAETGRWIADHTDAHVTLATTAAGALPYYAERYTLDLLGLNDAWIAHHVPARGHRPGHTKSAPFHYPLERKINYLIYHPTLSNTRPRAHPRYQQALKPWKYQWHTYQINSKPLWWGVWIHQTTPPLKTFSTR